MLTGICFLDFLIVCLAFLVKMPKIKISFSFQLRFYLKCILLAVIVALAISYLNPDNQGNVVIYFGLLFMLPYAYLSQQKRKEDEAIFESIIVYGNSMAELLRETGNVYTSLSKTVEQLPQPLQGDVAELLSSLDGDKDSVLKVVNHLERKYSYTIIHQLDIILLQMHYENSSNVGDMLDIFQQDLDALINDVKTNQQKRKVLRLQYIGLSVGCLLSMWLLTHQLNHAFGNEALYSQLLWFYTMIDLVVLFLVDQYFDNHISKE